RERKSITGPPGTVAARLARRTAPHPARRRWVSCRVPHTPSSPHPDFGTAYRNGTLDAFFDLTPGGVAGALAQPRTVRRTELVAALRRYAERIGSPPAVIRNVERLLHPEARAVVT